MNAKREYAVRHDIYGADAGSMDGTESGCGSASGNEEALRLGTRDANLFITLG